MDSLYFKSALLTLVQYSCLLVIFYMNSWLVDNLALLIVQLAGVFVGVWAIFEMRRGKLNIAPHIRQGAILITGGPYQFVRHPMYLALLLALLPLLSENQSRINLIVFLVFLINLILKLLFEEGLLRTQFPEYLAYTNKTRRLIPWIF